MVRLIIVGAAGRMGKRLIALAAADPELEVVGAVEAPGLPVIGKDAGVASGGEESGVLITDDLAAIVAEADVIIDFSAAAAVVGNARLASQAGCAAVIGTTGLGEADKAALADLAANGARLVFAPNMSIGVNLLFALSRQVASVLGDDYQIEIVEMHHDQKKDAPSGTAERLGEIVAEARGLDYASDTVHGRQGMPGARPSRQIGMHSLRGGDVVGEHTVIFAAGGERIELGHRASSRDTFAKGALRAAKFLVSAEPGIYDMQEVLGLT